jgi:hypothetical protein
VLVYGEKRTGVSFNLDHPDERELYQLASSMANSKEFSAWVKKHLRRELNRRKQSTESSITYRVEG